MVFLEKAHVKADQVPNLWDDSARRSEIGKRAAANTDFLRLLASGVLETQEPREEIKQRLDRSLAQGIIREGEFQSLAEFQSLLARSKLREISSETLERQIEYAPGQSLTRRRMIAVLRRQEG